MGEIECGNVPEQTRELTLTRPGFHLTARVDPAVAALALDGELDYDTTPALLAAVRGILDDHPGLRAVRLECALLRFCDTMGLAGLLQLHAATHERGISFAVCDPSPALHRLLGITGTVELLTDRPRHRHQLPSAGPPAGRPIGPTGRPTRMEPTGAG